MKLTGEQFYKDVEAARPYHISAGDTVKLAVVHYPDDVYDVSVLYEVWEVGGAQPVNSHSRSVETFWFLSGSGVAFSDGSEIEVAAGGFLVLPPKSRHRIANTGDSRLYAITTMSPDDGFAKLVSSGVPTTFDPEDLAVLRGLVSRR